MVCWFDTHCHLDYLERDGVLDAALARAHEADVKRMVTIGVDLSSFPRIHAIASAHEGILCTVGVHPHQASGAVEDKNASLGAENREQGSGGELAEGVGEQAGATSRVGEDSAPEALSVEALLARVDAQVCGIGETGLDFHYNERSTLAAQEASFRCHIEAAREAKLPVIVHTRAADEDTIRVLRDEHQGGGSFGGIIHCFSTDWSVAEAALELGMYISLSGIVSFRGSEVLRACIERIPLDRLLLETDAPYLAPHPLRGKPNEPSYLPHTARCVAERLDIDLEELKALSFRNALCVYRLSA